MKIETVKSWNEIKKFADKLKETNPKAIVTIGDESYFDGQALIDPKMIDTRSIDHSTVGILTYGDSHVGSTRLAKQIDNSIAITHAKTISDIVIDIIKDRRVISIDSETIHSCEGKTRIQTLEIPDCHIGMMDNTTLESMNKLQESLRMVGISVADCGFRHEALFNALSSQFNELVSDPVGRCQEDIVKDIRKAEKRGNHSLVLSLRNELNSLSGGYESVNKATKKRKVYKKKTKHKNKKRR